MAADPIVPDAMPVLSRGKHRSARRGACFMELASFLAGERWSDHPTCTHPLLAGLARHVNDRTSDEARPRLATLIPSVIGLTGDDLRLDVRVALRSAVSALPVVSEDRQRVMAVAVLTGERLLDDLDGRPAGTLGESSREALAEVPLAAAWAGELCHTLGTSPKGYRRHAAPNTVRVAVQGIATACIPDPDRRLYDLLAAAIADCRQQLGRTSRPSPAGLDWDGARRLTGTAGERRSGMRLRSPR
jgi:hypothetical protein